MFVAGTGDEFRCCFCPEPITSGHKLKKFVVKGQDRYAHIKCVDDALTKLVAFRDAKGMSEDKKQEL